MWEHVIYTLYSYGFGTFRRPLGAVLLLPLSASAYSELSGVAY